MSLSTPTYNEPTATSTLPEKPGVLVARKHHLLVRCSHWLNVPILLGLILSGLSIYWASPVYQHKPNPVTGNAGPLRTSVHGYVRMYRGCVLTLIRPIPHI